MESQGTPRVGHHNRGFNAGIYEYRVGLSRNNNTSGITTWWISTTTPSPLSLKTGLYSGHYSQQLYLLLLVVSRFSWLLEEGC